MRDEAQPDDQSRERIQARLLSWWDQGHRDLPWRRMSDPYAILVSETMLQQTQVSRVEPKYLTFLARFPTLAALAEAPPAEVIRAWVGLGYNRRAVNLHRLAVVVMREYAGELPRSAALLQTLPGVGAYTARAIASIAYGEPVAAVDTNVRRVLTRVVDGPAPERERTPSELQMVADAMLARARPGDWNQALMELGALVCLPVPLCDRCPLQRDCRAAGSAALIRERRAAYRVSPEKPRETFEGSARFFRGRVIEMLRAEPDGARLPVETIGARLRLDYTDADRPWLEALLGGLARDGLVVRAEGAAGLPPV